MPSRSMISRPIAIVLALALAWPLPLLAAITAAPRVPTVSANVLDYGARCDGVTDDGPAFNAAIDYLRNNFNAGASGDTVFGELLVPACAGGYDI